MAITQEQESLFNELKIKRAKDILPSVLRAMNGPIVNGSEDRHIIDIFTSEKYLQDDSDNHLASFVIMSPTELPMAFFSLRCGELFEKSTSHKMRLSHNAYIAIRLLMKGGYTKEQGEKAIAHIQRAKDEGLSIDDFENMHSKKSSLKEDEMLEVDKDITRVHKVHSAIEIKLFGINANARPYWESLGLPKDKKMGETLFWTKVVETIRQMLNTVGCEYVYLFAADTEAEGELVQYYRVRLNFGSNSELSANKPRFDYKSQFLFQSIKDLFKRQLYFFDNF